MSKQRKNAKYYSEHKEEYLKKNVTKLSFLALANCALWGISMLFTSPPEWVVIVWGIVFMINIAITLNSEGN